MHREDRMTVGDDGSAAATSTTSPRIATASLQRVWNWAGTWAFPFLLVLYLALSGGGYDAVVRNELGIVAWWLLLLAAAAGALPVGRRLNRATVASIGLLLAFTAWTAAGLIWTDSFERTVFEVGRVATLAGIFILALCLQGRQGLRRTCGAIATAIAIVAGLAVMSRIHPAWFPESDTAEFLPSVANRLAYPLNYWNGLAALMAMGAPLLLTQSVAARTIVMRALSTAAVPLLALAAFLTLSRGGAIAFVLGIAALVALSPRRLSLLPSVGLASLGSAILIVAADQRQAFVDALSGPAADTQGDEMLVMTVIVVAGVALTSAAFSLAAEHGLIRGPSLSRRRTGIAAIGAATLVLVAFVAAGGPGFVSDEWAEFKVPQNELVNPADSTDRYTSANGSDRYQFWSTAIDAGKSEALIGIGPGQYESYWAQFGSEPTFVRDAHSLYLEVFAELGLIGVLLLLGALLAPVVWAIRTVRSGSLLRQRLVASAGAGMIVFLFAAAVDWAWELTVLPVVFLLLAAAVLSFRSGERASDSAKPPVPGRGIALRVGLGLAAAALLVAIAVPLASLKSVRGSQDAAKDGNLALALEQAVDAESLAPAMAAPYLQQALVLEENGELTPAAAAAQEAVDREPTNWRNWFTLSRIEAERGNAAAALDAFREARVLNPRSVLFATTETTTPEAGSGD